MKNLKTTPGLFCLGLVALTMAFTVASCKKNDDTGSVLKFNPSKVEVAAGKTATVTVSGGTAPYTVVSSDSKIAPVKADKSTITVTGVKKGSATITVTDKNKYSGNFSVLVTDADASGINFDKKSVTAEVGKEDVVTVTGGTAPYTAESKDASIATATIKDNKVTIKGVKAGSTTITVADKDKKNSGSISVTIK